MEKGRKREWASRLLAVCMCMTVALMGIQTLPGTEAGKPNNHVPYYGTDTQFVAGWNLITFLCKPYTASNVEYTAHMVCERTRDNFNIERHLITSISYTAPNGVETVFTHSTHATDFTMEGGLSYFVLATEAGHIPISSGSSGFSFVPRHADQRLYGANESGYTGWNYVGYMWSLYFPPMPPGPPPPYEHWNRQLGVFNLPIKQLDGTIPYTDMGVAICQWNTTSDAWEMWDKYGNQPHVHDSNYGVGNLFWGLLIYMPTGGTWEIVN